MRGKPVCLLVAAVAVAAAACGQPARTAGPHPARSAAPSSATASAAAAVPPGYQRVGGAAQGISLAVPGSWVPVNLARESVASAAKKLGLSGVSAATIVSDIERVQSKHGIIVFDVHSARSNPGHFATNLNAFCLSSGLTDTGASALPLLKRELPAALRQNLHATDISQRDLTIGGVPGMEISYRLKSKIGPISETQLEVLPKPGTACIVTLTGPAGKLPAGVITEAAATARYP